MAIQRIYLTNDKYTETVGAFPPVITEHTTGELMIKNIFGAANLGSSSIVDFTIDTSVLPAKAVIKSAIFNFNVKTNSQLTSPFNSIDFKAKNQSTSSGFQITSTGSKQIDVTNALVARNNINEFEMSAPHQSQLEDPYICYIESSRATNRPYVDIEYELFEGDKYACILNETYGTANSLLLNDVMFKFQPVSIPLGKVIEKVELHANLSYIDVAGSKSVTQSILNTTFVEGVDASPSRTALKTETLDFSKTSVVIDITEAYTLNLDKAQNNGVTIATNYVRFFPRTNLTAGAFIAVTYAQAPPTQPIINNLFDNSVIALDRELRVEWSSENQIEYTIAYSSDGVAFTEVTGGLTPYHVIPADTFSEGKAYIKVKYSDGIYSEYSSVTTLITRSTPATPIGLTGGTISTAYPVISATGQNVKSWQIEVYEDGVLFESAIGTGEITYQLKKAVTDLKEYSVKCRYLSLNNLYSDWATSTITIAMSKPPQATQALTDGGYYIEIQITNTGTISSNEVFKLIESEWVRIAKGLAANDMHRDYFARSGAEESYKIRTFDTNFGYTESVVSSLKLTFSKTHLTSSDTSMGVALEFDPSIRESHAQGYSQIELTGREKPLTIYNGVTRNSMSQLDFYVKEYTEIEALKRLVDKKAPVCYRDKRGRKVFLNTTGLVISDAQPIGFNVTISTVSSNYKEGE